MSFRRGFKAEANRIAIKVREQLGLAAIDPIDPLNVCKHFDIQLMPLSIINGDSPFLGFDNSVFSAVTVPCGLNLAIVHNDSHHPYRQRSNICHELAHSFLGHKHMPPLTEDGERNHDGGIEAEANFLAGTLLITNEGALHILQKCLVNSAQEMYGVSEAMLNFRLRVSGAQAIFRRSKAQWR